MMVSRFFPTSLGAILLSLSTVVHSQVFDYIVVGGGTAGLAVANRLSANPSVSVLVIEVGDSVFNNPNVTGSDSYGKALGTNIDWQFQTVAQSFADGKTHTLHAGKAIGGTSTINGMAYTRLAPEELNAWAALNNDSSWNYSNFLQYYLKSENFSIPTNDEYNGGATYSASVHGFNGPLKTGYTTDLAWDELHTNFNLTAINLGIPPNQDINSAYTRGFTVYPRTVDSTLSLREDAARAYYWPYTSRQNLVLVPNSTVVYLQWQPGSKDGNATAYGVQAVTNTGMTNFYNATKEIIIAAGSLKTPQVLEVSGIGNPKILSKYGIQTIVPLPGVGEGLQDQINNAAGFSTNANAAYSGSRGYALYVNATDIFGSNTSAEATAIHSALPAYASKAASLSNGAYTSSELLAEFTTQYNLIFQSQVPMAEIVLYTSGTNLEAQYWGLLPFARGNVHITSADIFVNPSINPNYWMAQWDSDLQIGTAKFIRKYFATPALKGIVTGEITPGLKTIPASASSSTWASYLKSHFRPNYHPVGSAAMRPRAKGGVVDSRLKVYGTTNVRVVDASCWPSQVSGHLSSTVYAVAEKAAVMIQQDDGLLKH